jgi:hypothetical protein
MKQERRKRQLRDLYWAVSIAAWTRGMQVGNPDPKPLRRLDARIRRCKEALNEMWIEAKE